MEAPDQLSTIVYRLNMYEQQMNQMQDQLRSYVTSRENELQLRSIQETMMRVSQDLIDTRRQLTELNAKLVAQEVDAQKRDAALREGQDKLQIKTLWYIVSTVVGVLISVLVAFLSSFVR